MDRTVQYQTMDGWEATAIAWQVSKATNAYDPTWVTESAGVMTRLVNELGINRLQIPVRSGWMNTTDYWSQFRQGVIGRAALEQNWYNSQDTTTYQTSEFDFTCNTMLQPMLTAMASRGERLVISLVFTDNAGPAGKFDLARNPARYAQFVKFYIDRLRTVYGVLVDYVDVILEPDKVTLWQWGSLIGNAAAALKAAVPSVKLIAPSSSYAYNVLPTASAIESQSAGGLAALDTIAYHCYSVGASDRANIWAWATARGKKTAMSEWFDATMDSLLTDLTVANISYFQKWSIAGRVGSGSNPQSGYYLYNGTSVGWAGNGSVNTAPLSILFPYVRLGAVRVKLTVPSTLLRGVAFVNTNGKECVLLQRTSGSSAVAVAGLTPNAVYRVMKCAGPATGVVTPGGSVTADANGVATVTCDVGYTTLFMQ